MARRRPKYNAIKCEADGHKFDSKKERARYFELKLLERTGQISELVLQPKYPLMINKTVVARYISDFEYKDKTGALITEDVKSEITRKQPVYRLKNKMFAAQFGRAIKET